MRSQLERGAPDCVLDSLNLCSSGRNAWGESSALEVRSVSSKGPLRVWDADVGVAGRNGSEYCFPNKGIFTWLAFFFSIRFKKARAKKLKPSFFRGQTQCSQPVEVVSYKIGVCKVSPHGKECRTEFERLSYNGKSSVVLCRPFTGRMHQIRVHLQYLGKTHLSKGIRVTSDKMERGCPCTFCGVRSCEIFWRFWYHLFLKNLSQNVSA